MPNFLGEYNHSNRLTLPFGASYASKEIVVDFRHLERTLIFRCLICNDDTYPRSFSHTFTRDIPRRATTLPSAALKHLIEHVQNGDKVNQHIFDIIHAWLHKVGKDSFIV